jgi:hypothetical protein
MSFLDILGGLAGGLNSGLGQVQARQDEQRKLANIDKEALLRQYQEKRLQDAQDLAEAQAQYGAMEDGVEHDPTDPVLGHLVKRLGAAAFIKGPNGGLMKKQRAADALAEINLAEAQKNQPINALKREMEAGDLGRRQALIKSLESQFGPDWQSQLANPKIPLDKRQAWGQQLFGKNDALYSPQERLQYSDVVAAAHENAMAMAPYRAAGAQASLAQAGDVSINNKQKYEDQFDKLTEKNMKMMMLKMNNLPEYLRLRSAFVQEQMGPTGPAPAAPQSGGRIVYDVNGNPIR